MATESWNPFPEFPQWSTRLSSTGSSRWKWKAPSARPRRNPNLLTAPAIHYGMLAMGKSLASPTEGMIKEVSASFSEPQELSRERFVALDYFNKLPLEKSVLYTKYVDILSGLTLDSFEPGVPAHLRSTPHEIAHLVKEKDEPTLSLQVDSQMVRTEVHGTLEKEGIIFSNIHSALANNPELARSHFTKAIPPDDDKFAALNNAFFTAGTFLYVPQGLTITIPSRHILLPKTRPHAALTHIILLLNE